MGRDRDGNARPLPPVRVGGDATEGAGRALLSAIIEVTDDEGEIVLEFPFAEAILDMPDESTTRH